mmetsp:Transcript_114952/g.371632  ORF Transcript_114952/g.371632 Transcript_114952/m.371632 type:complete len:435 (-) Transcript_114952:119-1423(-)
MWSHRHWKEKMERAARRVAYIVEANGALNSCRCFLCPSQSLSAEHLLGPKHFNELLGRVPENMPVRTDDFWQTWTFETGTGAMAFNHADGTLRMVRRPDGNESVAPAPPPAPAVAGQSYQSAEISPDPHERVLAAVRVQPRPPPPPPVEVFASSQPATSSSFAPPAPEMLLASQQQQSATAGSTGGTVSPWGELSPVRPDAPANPHTIGTQQPPVSGVGVFLWFWQQHAAREVKRLEEVLVAALGSTVARYCELCQRSILPSESFAQHVAMDIGHMAQVQARFEHEGPSGRGWVQCWAGVAQLNHLTLDLSVDELRARGAGSEVAASTFSGTAVGGRASTLEAEEQPCAAVQQVAAASGVEEKQEDPRIVPAAAMQWETYQDPTFGALWYLNAKTGEVSWSDPTHMESCGTVGGGQENTSPTAALAAGTGGCVG